MIETETKTTLDKVKKGKDAVIFSINCDEKVLRRHILDMGLTPGAEVTMVKTAPLGDPFQIRVRGYELTIRKRDAAKIIVTNIHDAHNCPKKNKEFKNIEHSKKGETQTYETRKNNKTLPKTKISLALAGNQNCGKTTLFNRLTGSNQHVGNFPGVTVDKTNGTVKNHPNVTLIDLPGIYSLSPYSGEEIITRNFLLKEKPDAVINIVDAANLERNLFLTMQLIELEIPMVLALNMMDEVSENNGAIDINGLEAILGIPVIPVSAVKNEGVSELIEHAINVAKYNELPGRLDFCEASEGKPGAVHRCIHSLLHLIEDRAKNAQIPARFAATKLAEGDSLIVETLFPQKNMPEPIIRIIERMEEESGLDKEAAMADMRFSFIEQLCDSYVIKPHESSGHKLSSSLDKILTGKYTAIPSFCIVMALIFYFTFGPLGSFCSEIMKLFIGRFTSFVDIALGSYGLNPVVQSLVINGIFAGVGSVLSFLPVIVILFFFLSVLEDTGYMARAAFITDKLLRKIGLSGRSVVPMLSGFGCSVPAIMAARTLPSERDRKMTILLTPFMSCSAKLPIYALFTAAFFKENQVPVILSLYAIGVFAGIVLAYFMKFFVFKGEPVPFVMELPNYRMPSLLNIYRLIYAKSKDFVTKAFTIIFWAAIAVWFLQTFDSRLNLVQDSSKSILAALGNFVIPVFKPLGIDDWRISTAFITGFMAKENVVGTLSVLLGGDVSKLPELFNKLSAFVFLVFCLLYTPCVAAIATVRRELGKRYALIVILLQCSIAWIAAFFVYNAGMIFFKAF